MAITLTTEQLMNAATYIAGQLVDSVKAYLVPADVETFAELHNWVDANCYAEDAFADLDLFQTVDTDVDNDRVDDYENMRAAEDVAFAVFRLTADLDKYRAMVKPGFRIVQDAETFVKTEGKVYRVSYRDRALRAIFVSLDGNSFVNVRLASIKS